MGNNRSKLNPETLESLKQRSKCKFLCTFMTSAIDEAYQALVA